VAQKLLNKAVLLLNQNYEPMSVVDVRKAVVLYYLNKVEIVEKDGLLIRAVSVVYPVPSVVRLLNYKSVPRKHIMLSRKNVIKRDNFQCQYCGTKVPPFTVDHVLPKNRGGGDHWENLVCACVKCNNKKGNKLPEEAGMHLMRKPQKPSNLFFIQHFFGIRDERWKPYLYMN